MADLTIVVDVRQLTNGDWQTMSSYKIPPSGKIVFTNAAMNHGDLVISPKPPATGFPFCKNNGSTPETLPPIAPGTSVQTKICSNFNGAEFLYTAQIGTANPEDPIVIIERTKNFTLDPWTAGIFGLVVGAGIAYLIVKSRGNRTRPQQG